MRAVEGAGPRTGGPEDPLVVAEADGATLVDPDGNEFVDLAASFAAANLGHAHPEITAAVRDQVGRMSHVSSAFASEPRVAFEEALLDLAPAGLDRVLLGLSGADANDTAIKLARSATGRREVIAFSGGYFGRSGGVIGLNGKAAQRARAGRDADAHFLPYPYPYRWPIGSPDEAGEQAIGLVRHALEDPASGFGPIAAIVVEPVQGNGGVVIPPDGFLRGLRDLCDQHDVVLVFDEIQSGFGRTGRLWSAEHWGVVPDLMTVGKGIGGGMPVSAVVGRAARMTHWPPGTHTSTFMGNAVNLAAGRAAIEVMRRDRLWERAARLGAALRISLDADLAGIPPVGEVRGLGLFLGIEIVRDRGSRTPHPERADRIRRAAFDRGVLVGIAGPTESVLKICPPLTIDEGLLERAIGVLVETIKGDR
jgi:4-aminobutyrate aminotransferase-like enzyme